MSTSYAFQLVSAAISNTDWLIGNKPVEIAERQLGLNQSAAEYVVAEANMQAEKAGLHSVADASLEEVEWSVHRSEVAGEPVHLLVYLRYPNGEVVPSWMRSDGIVTNLENEFMPPPVSAQTGVRTHSEEWNYYPEAPAGIVSYLTS